MDGVSGVAGTYGTSGSQGISGVSGFSGSQGVAGATGVSGVSGSSGNAEMMREYNRKKLIAERRKKLEKLKNIDVGFRIDESFTCSDKF